jgi:hypothetical protein
MLVSGPNCSITARSSSICRGRGKRYKSADSMCSDQDVHESRKYPATREGKQWRIEEACLGGGQLRRWPRCGAAISAGSIIQGARGSSHRGECVVNASVGLEARISWNLEREMKRQISTA